MIREGLLVGFVTGPEHDGSGDLNTAAVTFFGGLPFDRKGSFALNDPDLHYPEIAMALPPLALTQPASTARCLRRQGCSPTHILWVRLFWDGENREQFRSVATPIFASSSTWPAATRAAGHGSFSTRSAALSEILLRRAVALDDQQFPSRRIRSLAVAI
jgi:hypothetical protein